MGGNIVYLVRHGQTIFNAEDRLGGDSELTQKGLKHAEKVAGYLAEIDLDAVYSSTLKRAVKTAEIILRYHSDIQFLIIPELAEISHGDMDSITYEEFRGRFHDMHETRKNDKYNWSFPNGESYRIASQRILPFWETIKSQGRNIVIVGHQATNRIILGHFLDLPEEEIVNLPIPNDGDFFEMNLINSTIFHIKDGRRDEGYKTS